MRGSHTTSIHTRDLKTKMSKAVEKRHHPVAHIDHDAQPPCMLYSVRCLCDVSVRAATVLLHDCTEGLARPE